MRLSRCRFTRFLVPFASSHCSFKQRRQHAVRPNSRMSPLANRRCLSSRCSRERHCGRVVIAPAFALAAASAFAGTFTLPLFGHSASTFLPPLAPPIYVDRFHSYYEGSDFCRRDRVRHIEFAPTESMPIGRPGPCSPSGPLWTFPDCHSHCHRQISLLIAFEFPTIPPPTTTSPFRCDRFLTLLHRRSLPCLSLGLTRWSREFAVARSGVRSFLGVSPTGLAETSSLDYGLVIHLRLLSTLPHGNAVTTVGYRPVTLA